MLYPLVFLKMVQVDNYSKAESDSSQMINEVLPGLLIYMISISMCLQPITY